MADDRQLNEGSIPLNGDPGEWGVAAVAAFDGLVAEWLNRLSDEWQEFDFDGLDDAAMGVVQRLTWARYAEQRTIVSVADGSDTKVAAEFVLSGFFPDKIPERLDSLLPNWTEWSLSEFRGVRLTGEGKAAKSDLADELLASHALAYVRGFFPNSPPRKCPGSAQVIRKAADTSNRQTDTATQWSRPMAKKQIAKLLGCPSTKKADWLNKSVNSGLYHIRQAGSRQLHQIDLSTVPNALRNSFQSDATSPLSDAKSS